MMKPMKAMQVPHDSGMGRVSWVYVDIAWVVLGERVN